MNETTFPCPHCGRTQSCKCPNEKPNAGGLSTLSGTELEVCQDIAARQRFGLGKYKTTLRDADLSEQQLAQHQFEELLDAAIYLKERICLMDKEWSSETPRKSGDYWWKKDNNSKAFHCSVVEQLDTNPASTSYEFHCYSEEDGKLIQWNEGLWKEAKP